MCVVFAQQSVASNLRGETTPAAPDALKINSKNVRRSIDVLFLCDFICTYYYHFLQVFVQCVHLKLKDFYFLNSAVAIVTSHLFEHPSPTQHYWCEFRMGLSVSNGRWRIVW